MSRVRTRQKAIKAAWAAYRADPSNDKLRWRLVMLYGPMTTTIINRLVAENRPTVMPRDDARQIARLRLWESIPKVNPDRANAVTYLYIRVRGAILDEIKRLTSRHTAAMNTKPLGNREIPVSQSQDPVDARIDVPHYLSLLSPLERQVVELMYLEDMPTADIAKMFGRSPSRIRQIKDRAMERMRSMSGSARASSAV